jgi:hypothetical protein
LPPISGKTISNKAVTQFNLEFLFIHLVQIINNNTYVVVFVKYFFKINKIYILYVPYAYNKINKEQFPC